MNINKLYFFSLSGQRIHNESTSSAGSNSSSSRYFVKSENLKRKKKPEILTIPPNTDGETDSEHSTKSRSCKTLFIFKTGDVCLQICWYIEKIKLQLLLFVCF